MAVEPGGGGKLRNKRNHGNKPYTRHIAENKSLFRRVTDTVANILIPTWMPNFMSWKSEEDMQEDLSGENHVLNEETNFESTSSMHLINNDNNVHASTSRNHPSTKLWPRASSRSDLTAPDGSYDSGAFSTQSVISNEFPQWSENEPRRSETCFTLQNQCVPPSNIHLIAKEPVPDNRSECSDASVSTSGCSSMIPHPDRREYQREILQLNDSSLRQLSEKLTRSCLPNSRPPLHVVGAANDGSYNRGVKESSSRPFLTTPDIMNSSVGEANTSVENRLGSASRLNESRNCIQHSKPQPSAVKKPSFNVDAFENPVWNDRSILNESLISSPFYGGPTSFGGASANRRNKYQSYLPYSAPSKSSKRPQVKVKNLNSTSDFDNLDGMSSTTRRILDSLEKMSTPLMDAKKIPSKSFTDTPFLLNSSLTRRPNLSGPDPPRSLTLRRGPPLNRLQTPITSRSSKQPRLEVPKSASENPKNDVPTFGWSSSSASSTYQNNRPAESRKMKTRQTKHYSSRKSPEEDEMPPLDLPQIPLPISTLPTFNFDLTRTPAVKPNDVRGSSAVNFRLPNSEKAMRTGKENDEIEYVFSAPLNVVVSEPKIKPKPGIVITPSTPNGNFTFKSTSILFKNKPQSPELASVSVQGSLGTAKELRTGSVMDFLKSSGAKTTDKSILPNDKSKENSKKQPIATWSCPKCAINNQDSRTTCASCDTVKPGHQVLLAPSGFGDKFKPKMGSWECPTCAIRNNSDASKCMACETQKPGSTASTKTTESSATTSSTATSFGGQFKMTGKWECDTCMVRNDTDATMCVACNTPRLNTMQKPATDTSTVPAFKFGFTGTKLATNPSSESSGFKFGGSSTTSIPSESTNIKFGVSATTTTSAAATESGAGAFKFGLPATDTANTTTTPSFKFGFQSDEVSKEKPTAKAIPDKAVVEKPTEKTKDHDDDDDDDVTEIIEEKSVFGLPAFAAPVKETAAPSLVFGAAKSDPPKPTEKFNFLSPKPVEPPKCEKHKLPRDDEEDEIQPKKKMQEPAPTFASFMVAAAATAKPLTASTAPKTQMPYFKPLEVSSTPLTTKAPIVGAVSTASSEFLTPSVPVTTTAASIFGQITTQSITTPGFFTPSAAPAMKIASSGPVFGAPVFGADKIGGFNVPAGSNSLFGATTTAASTVSTPSTASSNYAFFTTSANSAFGTSTTNSIFSPASSASVFQSTPTAVTTAPTLSFFATTPATSTKSTFSFGQTPTTAAAAVPQFGSSAMPTMAGAAAGSFSTPVTTSSFTPLNTTPNLFGFGGQNAAIFGRPPTTTPTTQVATPTTTAASLGFQGFGSAPRPAFQTPAAAPAFAPIAPTNRFAAAGTPSFQFGSNQQSQGIFTFTASQDKTEPEPATPFQFNQPATTTQGGFQFNPGTALGGFNFGTAAAGPITPFGTANTPQNPFEVPTTTAATSNTANRIVRRARRRK